MQNYAPRMRNNREYESNLNLYRLDKHYTIRDVCFLANVHPSEYCALNNGMMSPVTEKGKIRVSAQRICDALEVDFADAFPRYFCKLSQDKEVLYCQLVNDPEPEQPFDKLVFKQKKESIGRALSSLPARMQKVLKLMYWEDMTLDAVGEVIGVSRERVRQIQFKALRMLRHKTRSNLLTDCLNGC
jgi:RNA polymerase sigma factor (sigma-70 family)